MASMSDVAFLLIIFFIVTSSFSKPSKLPLELPGEKSETIDQKLVPAPRVRVGDARLFLNDQSVEPWQLTADLQTLLADRLLPEERVVIFSGEVSVSMDRVVEAMDAIRDAEAHVGFLELDVRK